MILGDIRYFNDEKHLFPDFVQAGVEAIRSKGLDALEPGKYEIQGDLMFALVQETATRPASQQRFESHDIYTDIQYLVNGEEKIGVSRLSPLIRATENRLETHDIAFYDNMENAPVSELVLKPGMFAVFFPADLHRPCCCVNAEGNVKKIVIKIHKRLWNPGCLS
jgi:biofilm protein TabA